MLVQRKGVADTAVTPSYHGLRCSSIVDRRKLVAGTLLEPFSLLFVAYIHTTPLTSLYLLV